MFDASAAPGHWSNERNQRHAEPFEKKNSFEQWDLSNSWLKACDLFVLARQITFSKDFSFTKKVSTPKFIWFQENCFSILIFFSFKLTHRLVCYYASCPNLQFWSFDPKNREERHRKRERRCICRANRHDLWIQWNSAPGRLGLALVVHLANLPPRTGRNTHNSHPNPSETPSESRKETLNKNSTKRSCPVVPVLPNDLCHWVLQSQCPRSLEKKKRQKRQAKRTWGWSTRSPKKVSIRTIVLWGTFESLHISLEWRKQRCFHGFATTWNSHPKIIAKERASRRGDYVAKSSHALVSTNRLSRQLQVVWDHIISLLGLSIEIVSFWKKESTILMYIIDIFQSYLLVVWSNCWGIPQMKNCKATDPIQVFGSLSNRMQVLEDPKSVVEDQLKITKSKSIHPNHQSKSWKNIIQIINHQRWIKINKVTNDPLTTWMTVSTAPPFGPGASFKPRCGVASTGTSHGCLV